jgi:hypothetical protein
MITTGMVLVDQIRTIDRTQRMFEIIEHAPHSVVADVRGRLAALLRLEHISLLPEQRDVLSHDASRRLMTIFSLAIRPFLAHIR